MSRKSADNKSKQKTNPSTEETEVSRLASALLEAARQISGGQAAGSGQVGWQAGDQSQISSLPLTSYIGLAMISPALAGLALTITSPNVARLALGFTVPSVAPEPADPIAAIFTNVLPQVTQPVNVPSSNIEDALQLSSDLSEMLQAAAGESKERAASRAVEARLAAIELLASLSPNLQSLGQMARETRTSLKRE